MSEISLLFGISGLSSDSHFPSPLLFFYLVLLLFLSVHLVIFLVMVAGSFFKRVLQHCFCLEIGSFCMALVEQLGDASREC